jgi:mono/diheme cytochrome c family protein
VQYVKWLAADVDASGKRVNKFDEAKARGELQQSVVVPPEPGVTVEALAKGKELFTKFACSTCHGETGAGDGPSAATLKDSWGLPLLPRDFNTGSFRGGHTGPDLYLRINNGLAGTPMLPFGESTMKAEDRWALVSTSSPCAERTSRSATCSRRRTDTFTRRRSKTSDRSHGRVWEQWDGAHRLIRFGQNPTRFSPSP